MRKHPATKETGISPHAIRPSPRGIYSLRNDIYYLREKALNYISQGDMDGYASTTVTIERLRDEHHETIPPGFIEEIEKNAKAIIMRNYLEFVKYMKT